ncbi:ScbA/BarX family gamma-butyrolactone biosynthesis protein [Streptomyces sp. NPDC048436]|uniref:ScbA/BarX family gamma-butyrolactone biosynthesis protein n=1 Tax=Streptomyces sp. NPDC048436 TaxID=3365550 RepID=UPI00371D96AE
MSNVLSADVLDSITAGSLSTNEAATTTVPKEFLHLHREESALVTGWTRLGSDQYMVTAAWPEPAAGGAYDPLKLTQTIRQACLLIAHAERGVPLKHQTLMERLDFSFDPGFRTAPGRTDHFVLDVTCRGTGPRSMSVDFTVHHDGRAIGESTLTFSWIGPAVYRRLRGEHLQVDWAAVPRTPAAPAGLTGCDVTSRIAITPTERPGRWQLRTDTSDITLYDHPVDHVPGLALIEAAYQAAHVLTGPDAPKAHQVISTFDRYIEFDAPCWIEAVATGSDIRVTGTQDDRTAFTVTLRGAAA